jgi:hypothetical protein
MDFFLSGLTRQTTRRWVTLRPCGIWCLWIKNIASVPATLPPTPWDSRPNSLAADWVHIVRYFGCLRSWCALRGRWWPNRDLLACCFRLFLGPYLVPAPLEMLARWLVLRPPLELLHVYCFGLLPPLEVWPSRSRPPAPLELHTRSVVRVAAVGWQ